MVALGGTFIPRFVIRRTLMPATAVDLSIILMHRFTIFLSDKALAVPRMNSSRG
jgi:hypothetical protein